MQTRLYLSNSQAVCKILLIQATTIVNRGGYRWIFRWFERDVWSRTEPPLSPPLVKNEKHTQMKSSILTVCTKIYKPRVYINPFLGSKGGYLSFLPEINYNFLSGNCIWNLTWTVFLPIYDGLIFYAVLFFYIPWLTRKANSYFLWKII